MATEIPTPPPKKSGFPIWIPIAIGAFFVLVLVLAMAAFVALPQLLKLTDKGASNSAPVFADSDWGQRTVKEIRLDAPCEFGPGPNVMAQLPAEVQNAIQYMEVYQSQNMPENFLIMISRIRYVDGVEVDLDGAMQGAMTEAGGVVGDINPQFTSKVTRISKLDGRYGKYDHKFGKTNFRLQTIVAGQGESLWQVQVVYEHEASAKDANRVLDSIEINL